MMMTLAEATLNDSHCADVRKEIIDDRTRRRRSAGRPVRYLGKGASAAVLCLRSGSGRFGSAIQRLTVRPRTVCVTDPFCTTVQNGQSLRSQTLPQQAACHSKPEYPQLPTC